MTSCNVCSGSGYLTTSRGQTDQPCHDCQPAVFALWSMRRRDVSRIYDLEIEVEAQKCAVEDAQAGAAQILRTLRKEHQKVMDHCEVLRRGGVDYSDLWNYAAGLHRAILLLCPQ